MRISYLLSAFLASLAIASPIANPEAAANAELEARENYDDTPEYTAAIKAHGGLEKDKYYYFALEWPLGIAVGDGDQESSEELKELQQKLGFEHIGLVVGEITEKKTGKGKNEKTKRDFVATLYHMVKKNVNPGDTLLKTPNYTVNAKQNLVWGGETSKKKADKVKKAAKDYVDDHKIYKVDGNNCNDFYTDVKKTVA